MKIEGGQALARQLGQLPRELSRQVQVNALKAAAEPIRTTAEALAPRDDQANSPHLDQNIVIGAVTEARLENAGRTTETVVEVGPAGGRGGDDFFYGFFQEYGTAHHEAQPFMRPAFDEESRRALNILVDELWWSLRRGITGPEKFVA